MTDSYDVAIIGAGSAGLAALREVRKRTEKFVLINDGPYGTTCARVGCMPSKALIEAANAYHRRKQFEEFGIRGGDSLRADIPAVLQRVRDIRDDLVAGVLKATDSLGERNIQGRARLIGPQRIAVSGLELTAKRIVLAVGSRPVVPDEWRALIDDAGHASVLTTDTLFEQETLPKRIGVVGLGAVGVEMAQALSRLGLDVVALGSNPLLAGLTDRAVSDSLLDVLRSEFSVYTKATASLSRVAKGIEMRCGNRKAVVDCVLAALGRRPNLDDIGLESLGLKLDERGLPPVDARTMQIADLPIFLAGDANGSVPLLHEAADEGHIAGINAMLDEPRCFKRRVPMSIVFSDPPAAIVGQPFGALDPANIATGEVSFERQGRARIALRNKGLMKLYADKRSAKLVGAELCAPAADHMAHLLALAIERSLTVHDLLRLPFYHPVFEEGLRTGLRSLAANFQKRDESDLGSCDATGVEALD